MIKFTNSKKSELLSIKIDGFNFYGHIKRGFDICAFLLDNLSLAFLFW